MESASNLQTDSSSNDRLVSVVIPTWQRERLLYDCVENILKQTYRKIEIIIVSDGRDENLEPVKWAVHNAQNENFRLIELGRNWSGLDQSSFGIAALLVGYLCARGNYIMPWCDDERALDSQHIEKLVNLMETPCVEPDWTDADERLCYPDFVYPRCHIWRNGSPNNQENTIIGTMPPTHGQITHYLFKPSNFVKFGYPDWGSHPVDWNLVDKWIKNKANYAMLDEVTFSHRLDQ